MLIYLKKMKTSIKVVIASLFVVFITGGIVFIHLTVYQEDKNYKPASNDENFRTALSVSPFSGEAFEKGYQYKAGELSAENREELEKVYAVTHNTVN